MTTPFPSGYPESAAMAKAQAKRLGKALESSVQLSHSQLLELVAKMHGERSWGAMNAQFANATREPVAALLDLGLQHTASDAPPPDLNHGGWKPSELEQLVTLLRTHPKVNREELNLDRFNRIVADGCVSLGSIDDLFDAISPVLGEFAFAMKGQRLAELFGIRTEGYLHRPEQNWARTSGSQAISVAGAATLLLKLDRLGLDTHPEHLVSTVNKAIVGRRMLTSHELACLWYRTEKAGAGRQRLMATAFHEESDAVGERFVTATGHICTVYRDEAGQIETVVVDLPNS